MTDSPAQPLDVAAGRTLAPAAVCMRGITKLYPGVVANDAIDFSVEAASIHGLLGENGAGKSTLMKVLFGLTTPTAGTVEIAGQQVVVDSARDALDLGIGMVQQHFSLIADFTVAENLVLGREPLRRGGLLDLDRAAADIAELSDRYGFRIDPRSRVGDLAVGARQRVEILKALYRGAEVLILDEPTAALAPNEVAELVALLRRLRDQGRAVVFISHKLSEVIDLCDRVTVLRGGRVEGHREIGTAERDDPARHDALAAELARMMVGRELPEPPERASGPAGPTCRCCGSKPRATGAGSDRSTWRCSPARSWAWPAWRATARPSWWRWSWACAAAAPAGASRPHRRDPMERAPPPGHRRGPYRRGPPRGRSG